MATLPRGAEDSGDDVVGFSLQALFASSCDTAILSFVLGSVIESASSGRRCAIRRAIFVRLRTPIRRAVSVHLNICNCL
jgi:hypothetical protein